MAFFAFGQHDSGFAGIKINGLALRLLQHFARILDTLPTPHTILVSFNVIGRLRHAAPGCRPSEPILLQFVVLGLSRREALFIGDLDIFKDIDPAGIAFLVLRLRHFDVLLSVLLSTDVIDRKAASKCKKISTWRRGRDLNPRYPLRYVRFRGGSFQPLTHLSAP